MKAKTGKMSDFLLAEKTEQVIGVVGSNPYEAMTKAMDLFHEYPEDERAVALFLEVALKAKAKTGKDVMTENAYLMGQRFANLIWMSPTLTSLHIISKALMDKPIVEEDITAMKRSIKMGPEVTTGILEDAKKALGNDHHLFSVLS